MFQGMARGRVGDVIFTRKNGQQVSRVRNRSPKNPKTNAQLYQRAVMATMMQAYSAGKAIFDHSFQGYPVGGDNQNRFMALNNKLLRAAVAADVANGMTGLGCAARVIGPGVVYPVPWTYQVSEGSLTQDIFNADGSMRHIGDVADETIAQYCTRMGIQSDDIFTVVFFACALNDRGANIVYTVQGAGDQFGEQTLCQFAFARLRVNTDALTSASPITAATPFSTLFRLDLESNFTPDLTAHQMGSPLLVAAELPFSVALFTSGVIRSRDNQDLRSTCKLEWTSDDNADYGLTTDYLLQAWSQGAAVIAESDLILEGGAVRRQAANHANQVTVADMAGQTRTIVGVEVGEAAPQTNRSYVLFTCNDGSKLHIFRSSSDGDGSGSYLEVSNAGSYSWARVTEDAPAAADTVDIVTEPLTQVFNDDLTIMLIKFGVPVHTITA